MDRGDSTKFDGGKIMFDLLPFAEVEDVARVLTYGAKKYEKDGWKKVPDGLDRYFAALMRHLTAYKLGQEIDEESGLTHLSHACTNLMFIMYLEKNRTRDKK